MVFGYVLFLQRNFSCLDTTIFVGKPLPYELTAGLQYYWCLDRLPDWIGTHRRTIVHANPSSDTIHLCIEVNVRFLVNNCCSKKIQLKIELVIHLLLLMLLLLLHHVHAESWTNRYPLPPLDLYVPFANHGPLGTVCQPWTFRYPLLTLDLYVPFPTLDL